MTLPFKINALVQYSRICGPSLEGKPAGMIVGYFNNDSLFPIILLHTPDENGNRAAVMHASTFILQEDKPDVKVSVSATALHHVLRCLLGPAHYIRELQATMSPIFDNPIRTLLEQYNEEARLKNLPKAD